MSLRWPFLSLSLLLSAPAFAEDGVAVRVRCTEKCTVTLDQKTGRRVDDSTWEFKGITPGSHRIDATGLMTRPLAGSFVTIPDVASADIFLASNKRIIVEPGSTTMPGTPEWAEPNPPQPPSTSTAPSVVIVKCRDACTAMVDTKPGIRRDARTWEFQKVAPGSRRVEAVAGVFNRQQFLGYVDVPGGSKVTVQGDSQGRAKLVETQDLSEARAAKSPADSTKTSLLQVRCTKPCTVTLDGQRRGTSNATNLTLRDVPPGSHELQVDFTVGGKQRRAKLDVPASHELFITASEDPGVQVTNTKPLTGPL
ncbi:hypothetical protein [Comamonas sp. JC664]|uniref:hypothetical protein n=1 Tax=Comamonas sp. JC664 TaxID=2801917 RepID=UPI0017480308|nr:hypothetical protein [Comamonas sp. JC664]MBL0698134.1 hypothetical protein [Comamonas sp. JC664]GHG88536.1 hypothetical protein GCM10012319_47240 [Comamonas sp. KCTC 72670]